MDKPSLRKVRLPGLASLHRNNVREVHIDQNRSFNNEKKCNQENHNLPTVKKPQMKCTTVITVQKVKVEPSEIQPPLEIQNKSPIFNKRQTVTSDSSSNSSSSSSIPSSNRNLFDPGGRVNLIKIDDRNDRISKNKCAEDNEAANNIKLTNTDQILCSRDRNWSVLTPSEAQSFTSRDSEIVSNIYYIVPISIIKMKNNRYFNHITL